MAIRGGFLRLVMILAYFTAFIIAAYITGVFAWFIYLDTSSINNRATLGLAALTTLYTLVRALTICCTAGFTILAIAGILSDICFLAAFMAIAIINRSGSDGCDNGNGRGRGGRGNDNFDNFYGFDFDTGNLECRLYVAAFAVAIVGCFLMLVTIVSQALVRRRRGRGQEVTKGQSATSAPATEEVREQPERYA